MTDRILALEQRVSKLEVVMRTSLMYVPEEAPPGAEVRTIQYLRQKYSITYKDLADMFGLRINDIKSICKYSAFDIEHYTPRKEL